MADILDGEQLKRNILSDMRVELTEEFDKNFERKAFFTDKWKSEPLTIQSQRTLIVKFHVDIV